MAKKIDEGDVYGWIMNEKKRVEAYPCGVPIPDPEMTDYTVEYYKVGQSIPFRRIEGCMLPIGLKPVFRYDLDDLDLYCHPNPFKRFCEALHYAITYPKGRTVIRYTQSGKIAATTRVDSSGHLKMIWH